MGIRGDDVTRSLEFKLRRLECLPAIEADLLVPATIHLSVAVNLLFKMD